MRERCADCELTETALAQLRALVGELVDALCHADGEFCQTHNDGSCNCGYPEQLIARARKALKP